MKMRLHTSSACLEFLSPSRFDSNAIFSVMKEVPRYFSLLYNIMNMQSTVYMHA